MLGRLPSHPMGCLTPESRQVSQVPLRPRSRLLLPTSLLRQVALPRCTTGCQLTPHATRTCPHPSRSNDLQCPAEVDTILKGASACPQVSYDLAVDSVPVIASSLSSSSDVRLSEAVQANVSVFLLTPPPPPSPTSPPPDAPPSPPKTPFGGVVSLLDDVAATLNSGGFGVSLGGGSGSGGGNSGTNSSDESGTANTPANVTATREEVNELLTAGASALESATEALDALTEVRRDRSYVGQQPMSCAHENRSSAHGSVLIAALLPGTGVRYAPRSGAGDTACRSH